MWNKKMPEKVLVIGSGPIVIGQAAEFDYAGTQACLALKEEGVEVVLVNNNPATIMTDEQIADTVYMEPLNIETLEKIIAKERPSGMIGTLGGQTGLNLTVELYEKGVLDRYGVELLGTSVSSIQKGEDREKFRQLMIDIGEPVSESKIISTLEQGMEFIREIGYPVILRPAYTLGGEGGGFANNEREYIDLLQKGLKLSPINQVLVEKSIKGWKEIEYEVMRDSFDQCVIVCGMENIDPVGVHTGDSIVAAPTQTLSVSQENMLRESSKKVIRALDVVGGCNIQFALHPNTNEYFIIEVNPRVSRSSALASKATGYPIAHISTMCALGFALDHIQNPMTGISTALEEPLLDYTAVKIPRFPFDKFTEADRTLGTQMKATGEVMAIDVTFAGALNKAVRSLELNNYSLHWPGFSDLCSAEIKHLLQEPNDLRLYAIAEAFSRGMNKEEIQQLTEIDPWFLEEIESVIDLEKSIAGWTLADLPEALLLEAKKMNISDYRIAQLIGVTETELRENYRQKSLHPVYKAVQTTGEKGAAHSYYYSTWNDGQEDEPGSGMEKKILVLGSGPIRIGQGVEFDYCSVHAALAVKKMGYKAIVINNNPETVSTDYSVADRLYFEPLAEEDVLRVIEKENVEGVLIQFGGQTAINLADHLRKEGVHIFGTLPEHIDQMEDREQFYHFLNRLNISHITGHIVHRPEDLTGSVQELGFPVLIRPSFVIGGQSMFICYDKNELEKYVHRIQKDTNDQCWPLLIDQYIPGKECEVDVISDGYETIIPGIFEHIEKAGVHSGDSIAIHPPVSLTENVKKKIIHIAQLISRKLPIIGMMNIQFVIKDEHVYVLEVNPRASRTVPIMSKVTKTPMTEWAVKAQLGAGLGKEAGQVNEGGEPDYFTVKAPVFSANKLKGVDHVLGPEMKSTGEIIGISSSRQEALKKAVTFSYDAKSFLKEGNRLFVSVSDRMKEESMPLIRLLNDMGLVVNVTKGTGEYLTRSGVKPEKVVETKEALLDYWKETPPDVVLNIASQGREKEKMGYFIRELAVRHQTPYFTSLETLMTMAQWLKEDKTEEPPASLNSYTIGLRLARA
ncbi:carbamoyl-phosphate synthase (glutamine-hydrolyzing) large subunit [Virgibacillus kimchii]